MKPEIFIRYCLEISMIIPIVIFAVLPVRENLKNDFSFSFCVVSLILLTIFAGAYVAANYNLRVRSVMFPFLILFFVIYIYSVKLTFNRKLFCFFNSAMISALCPMFAIFISAPYELINPLWETTRLFSLESGLVCLGISFVLGLMFFRTLTKKLPFLLREESLSSIWNFLCVIPSAMFIFIVWSTPLKPYVVLTGRVKPVGFALMFFITSTAILFYHVFWRITIKLTESSELRSENDLLKIEGKRYDELKTYMEKTKALRHDFRQHIAVMSNLSKAGKFFELENYISQLSDRSSESYGKYCANNAVDAVASYYDSVAKSQETKISWNINLPSKFPMKESDFCAMFGNLVENALNAVKKIPVKDRQIKIMSSMLSHRMLGLSIDNKFESAFNVRENRGTGLISVSNTVKRYGGTLNINTENNIFSVDIILYFN